MACSLSDAFIMRGFVSDFDFINRIHIVVIDDHLNSIVVAAFLPGVVPVPFSVRIL